MAGELLMSISQNERERAIFRSRKKFQTDLQSDLATAEDIGRKIGKAEGRAEGLVAGRAEGKVEIARNMLSVGLSLETIMQCTGLTQDDLKSLCSD